MFKSPSPLNLYNIYLDTKVTIDDADVVLCSLDSGDCELFIIVKDFVLLYMFCNGSYYYLWMPVCS